MKTFIVYQLRDSREESPFYIGKTFVGSDRYWRHLTSNQRSTRTRRKIRSLLKSYVIPVMEVLYETASEVIAFRVEEYFIKVIGRIDQGKGPLLNHTDGGEGTSGRPHTIEARKKMSEEKKRRYAEGITAQKPGGGSSREVSVFDVDGSLIGTYLSGKIAADTLGLPYHKVASVMSGKSKFCKREDGSVFRISTNSDPEALVPIGRKPIDLGSKVSKYTLGGEFVESFRSIRKAGISAGCCHKNLTRKIAKGEPHAGFFWRYGDGCTPRHEGENPSPLQG